MTKYIERERLVNVREPQLLNIGKNRIVEIKLAGGGTGEMNVWFERDMNAPDHSPAWFLIVPTGGTYPPDYEHIKMLITRSGTETHVLRQRTTTEGDHP